MLVRVENFCLLEMMEDPNRKDGFDGKLVQYWKSVLRITCITMELESNLIPCGTMDLNPGL